MDLETGHGQQQKDYKMGDIVWVHVKGFPWWPGQVMGMCQVSAKMLADRQPHTKPVSTMGDSQYCWAMPCDILRFQESRPSIKVPKRLALVHPKPAMEHTQRTLNLRSFKEAAEEAKEILDRRSGATPATSHFPLDFLNPPEGTSILASDAQPVQLVDKPDPPSVGDFSQQSPRRTLESLHSLARNPGIGFDRESAFARIMHHFNHQRLLGPKRRQSSAKGANSEKDKLNGHQQRGKRRRSSQAPQAPSNSTEAPIEKVEEEQPRTVAMDEWEEAKPSVGRGTPGDDDEKFEPRSEGSDKPKKRKYTRRKKPEGEAAELQKESEGEEEVVLGFYQQGDKAAAVEYLQRLALIPSCEGFQPFSQPYAQARAILLLHREMAFKRSAMNRKQHWGRLAAANTQQALSLSGQHSQGADKDKATPGRRSGPGKPAQGIPVEVPTIGSTARFKTYADIIPGSAEAFQSKLDAFYQSVGKTVASPIIERQPIDFYSVFRAVAALGGFESVCFNRQWKAVAKQWREDLSNQGRAQLQKKYIQHLLAFEFHVSDGAPERELTHRRKASRGRAGGDDSSRKAGQVMKRQRKRRSAELAATDSDGTEEDDSEGIPPKDFSTDDEDTFRAAHQDDRMKNKPEESKPGQKPTRKEKREASRAAVRPRTTSAGAFDTLADDPKARARSKLPPKPNQGSHQESRNPKVAPSNKPLSEQKRVIKLKFAQGVEMVSRGRQTAELNKHRGLQDFQMIAKHNTALAVFASEAHAEAACAALREKAHLVWRIPKDALSISQQPFHEKRKVPLDGKARVAGQQPQGTTPKALQLPFGPKQPQGAEVNQALPSASEASPTVNPPRPAAAVHTLDPRATAVVPNPGRPIDPRTVRHSNAGPRMPFDPRQRIPQDPRQMGMTQPVQNGPNYHQQRHMNTSVRPLQIPKGQALSSQLGPVAQPMSRPKPPPAPPADPRRQPLPPSQALRNPSPQGSRVRLGSLSAALPPNAMQQKPPASLQDADSWQQSSTQFQPIPEGKPDPAQDQAGSTANLDSSTLLSILEHVKAMPAQADDLQPAVATQPNAARPPPIDNQAASALHQGQQSSSSADPRPQRQPGVSMEKPELAGESGTGLSAQMLALMSKFTQGQGVN